MSVYRIDKERIKIYKNIFDSDYNDFLSKKMMFENSYICTNNEPSLQNIKNTLKRMYDDIEKSYSKIKKWWNEYIEEYEKIESNLNKKIDNIGLGVFDIISKELENIYVKTANNIVYGSNVATSAINEVLENIPKNTDSVTEVDNVQHGGGRVIHNGKSYTYEEYKELTGNKFISEDSDLGGLAYIINDVNDYVADIKDEEVASYMYGKIQKQIELYEYTAILESSDYKFFKKSYDIDDMYDYIVEEANNHTTTFSYKNINFLIGLEYEYANGKDGSNLIEHEYNITGYGYMSIYDMYKYMSEDERNLFNYLYIKKGKEEADKYMCLLVDGINQQKGAELAAKEIEEFALYYSYQKDGGIEGLAGLISSYNFVSIKGMSNGFESFFNGLESAIKENKYLSADDYATSIFYQYLQENTDLYGEIYEVKSAVSRMIPSLAVSALVTAGASPVAGAKVGSMLSAISSGGSARQEALVNGHSSLYAAMYGVITGSSEAITEYFLGGIPGLSKIDETSGILKRMFKEGFQELTQEWFDTGVRELLLGEEIDLKDATIDSVKAFLMGAIVSGYINGAEKTLNFTIKNAHYTLPLSNIIDILNNNNGFVDLDAFENLISNNATYYGSYQGDPYEVYTKFFKSKKIRARAQIYEDIVKTNIKNPNVKTVLSNLDNAGCSYAAAAISLIDQFTQINGFFDIDKFEKTFNISLKVDENTVDENILMLDIYSTLYDAVKFNYYKYDYYTFDSHIDAAKELLNINLTDNTEALIELLKSGYQGDGYENGKLRFRKKKAMSIVGTPSEIAEKLFNIKDEDITMDDIFELLNENIDLYDYSTNVLNNRSAKLSTSFDEKDFMNYYLSKKGVSMNFESSTVAVDELSYYANKGYTIKVAADNLLNEGVKLYNEKYKFYDAISGHAMTFKGFNENGDMIVNSWNKNFIIKQEDFLGKLRFQKRKLNTYDT